MKKILLTIFSMSLYFNSIGVCDPPITVYNSNINYYNADVNWNYQTNIDRYRIRYRIVGATSWSYKHNIDSNAVTQSLNNLTPLNYYHWQIRSFCDSTTTNYSQWSIADTFYTNTINCPSITGQFINNISYYNATSNWAINSNANRYKIRYKNIGDTNWVNSGPIYQPNNNEVIPGLDPSTTYEWEVMAYYDSTTQYASLWSVSDTFTTSAFIASIFNPNISNSIDNSNCNNLTNLSLYVSQTINEPDIGTSTITSDGGYFDIQSLLVGDSVGYALMNLATQTISSTLKLGFILSQDYAIVNSYDSAGNIIGYFSIENENGGIKISSTSPNDGNNYTSGFTSEIQLTNLFINPNINGPLNFYTNIESELNDQYSDTSTIIIDCINQVQENINATHLGVEIYDLLGRKTKFKKNTTLIYKYANGEFRKINIQKK